MHLLFLTETHPPDRGGMSESCDRILRGLAREGAGLDVVHFDRRASRFDQRATSSGSILRVPPEADAAHLMNLVWNRIGGMTPTHVVAFGGTLPLLGAPVFAAWLQKPLVTMIRGNELDTGLFDPRRRPMLDDALRRASAVCTVTQSHAEKIAALHEGVEPHVVANGIDFELWQATPADAARAAAIREAAGGKRILGLFGHLKNKKGVPFFVDALVRSGAAERFHLLFAGELETPIEGIAHTLLPVMDRYELIPYYLASDLVVLPSHYDGFPNVLIEAMALARPLLASTAGGMRDVLADGEEAFLFAPGGTHACRHAIVRTASASDDELRRMGAAAEAVARRRCDARDETRRYLEVLHHAQEAFDAKRDSRRDPGPAARELWRRAR
ncbi:MAG TPA: glycosyltransferase family 4 protein [Thermoanaerobaculia bacterium]|nr:glycosyltransferase family 4 protein [Thermoanaerobaculia bacterium]